MRANGDLISGSTFLKVLPGMRCAPNCDLIPGSTFKKVLPGMREQKCYQVFHWELHFEINKKVAITNQMGNKMK